MAALAHTQQHDMACAPGPLTSVRVIDITTIFTGPSATQLLGDLGADVLTYKLRPRAIARFGLEYDTMAAVSPRLIYAGMFRFSQRGRYAASAAFDDLIQAACAPPQSTALSSGDIPRYLPITIADCSVGLYALGVIAAALYGRERSGYGGPRRPIASKPSPPMNRRPR